MGVGGAGASSAFAIARKFGYTVSGCDKFPDSPYLSQELKKLVSVGHDPTHLLGFDVLVYSPAVPLFDSKNPELVAAEKKGLELLSWEEFAGKELLKERFVIAVAGTHGKGTITAMLAKIMVDAGKDPTVLIGGLMEDGKNSRVGKSKYFIIEADEFKESFLNYRADLAIVSNIDFDHPEYFESLAKTRAAFTKFLKNTKAGSILIAGPDVALENPNGRSAVVSEPVKCELKIPGHFNKMNAAFAAAAARELLISEKKIKSSLEKFKGLKRRLEFVGEEKGILVFDDYAHHPRAIRETLSAVREKFPNEKLTVVFEPHTFSRTKGFFKDFVDSFRNGPVDRVVVLDIFASREKFDGSIHSKDLVKSIGGEKGKYLATSEEAAVYLTKEHSVGEVILYMSAGNWQFPHILLKKLRNKG